jgi:hypothetical protein
MISVSFSPNWAGLQDTAFIGAFNDLFPKTDGSALKMNGKIFISVPGIAWGGKNINKKIMPRVCKNNRKWQRRPESGKITMSNGSCRGP